MPFNHRGGVTPKDKLSKNFKGKKSKKLNDSHLTRGVIKAQEDGNDLSLGMRAILKMPDQDTYLEGIKREPAKEGFIYKPCPDYIMEIGTRQDIRVKPSKTTEDKLPSHAEKSIKEHIDFINNLTSPKDEVL